MCLDREHIQVQKKVLQLILFIPKQFTSFYPFLFKTILCQNTGKWIFFHLSCFVKGEWNILTNVPSLCLPSFTLQWIFIAGYYKILGERNRGSITEDGKVRFTNRLWCQYWGQIRYTQIYYHVGFSNDQCIEISFLDTYYYYFLFSLPQDLLAKLALSLWNTVLLIGVPIGRCLG